MFISPTHVGNKLSMVTILSQYEFIQIEKKEILTLVSTTT